ncbi:hypothetical protein OF83DRAFT_1148167, partial [Amylostereum chailletii]
MRKDGVETAQGRTSVERVSGATLLSRRPDESTAILHNRPGYAFEESSEVFSRCSQGCIKLHRGQ